MVHPGGRPQEYDRIQIGKDFVEWATDNLEALTVPMFAGTIGIHSGIMRNWSRENEEFRVLFMQGKEQIGINRLKAAQQDLMDNSVYRAHIGNFDIDINEYMREEKSFEANLSKDVQDSVNDKIIEHYGEFHQQLRQLRETHSKSTLNHADNTNNTDNKSA